MSDDEFLAAFEECRMPAELWTHEAHVRMAWLYLRRRPIEEVVSIVRDGIRRYAVSRGKADAYHETMTLASLALIDQAIDRGAVEGSFAEFSAANPDLLDRTLPALLKHYSRDLLDSNEARKSFVQADRVPLPRGFDSVPSG